MIIIVIFVILLAISDIVLSTVVQVDNISDILFPPQNTVLNSSFAGPSGLPYASIVIPSSVLKRTSLLRKFACQMKQHWTYLCSSAQTMDQLLLVVFCIAQYQGCYQTIPSSNESCI